MATTKKQNDTLYKQVGTVEPIANGGTNSSTPLVNGRAIISNGGQIVESSVTVVELQHLSGSTSNIQAQLNNKQKKFLSDGIVIQEDWLSTTPTGSYTWQINTTGAGSTVTSVNTGTDTNHQGVVQLTTSSAAGRATLSLLANSINLGGGVMEYRGNLRCVALSDATNEYIAYLGLGDNVLAGDMTDGVYFVYDRLTSLNWQLRTASAGVRTNIITSVPVVAGSWVRFGFIVNAGATSVTFTINGTAVGTINTNIPTGANLTNPFIGIKRSAGGGAKSILADYYNLTQEFTSIR